MIAFLKALAAMFSRPQAASPAPGPLPTQNPSIPPVRPAPGRSGSLGVDLPAFVTEMGVAEGTKDHMGSEGQFTYAYGILPATAKALGVDANKYPSRYEFAKEVYARMLNQMKVRYPRVPIDQMKSRIAHAVFSFYINLGSFQGSVLANLEKGDVAAAMASSLQYITYQNRATKVRYISKGLAVRRAKEYNAAAPYLDLPKIVQVSLMGNRSQPNVRYERQGTTPIVLKPGYALSPDNSMTTAVV